VTAVPAIETGGVPAARALWYRFQCALVRGTSALLALVPVPALLALADGAARLAFLALRSRRRIAVDNILGAGVSATPAEARAMARDSFRTLAMMVVESAIVRRRMTRENWTDYVDLQAPAEVEALLRQPARGLIVASAHLGNWEVAAHVASLFKPTCVIYRPFNNPYLDRAVRAQREADGLRLVSRFRDDPMRFVRALASGEIVALMVDQHAVRGERVAVQFFGRPAWATKSVAMLHLTTRVPLLLACAVRLRPLRYALQITGPVTVARTGDREKDAAALMQALTAEIESVVRRYPDQYMWGHRRWRASRGATP
jgi:KDO2-lipid IV(A) lauroyltransferase